MCCSIVFELVLGRDCPVEIAISVIMYLFKGHSIRSFQKQLFETRESVTMQQKELNKYRSEGWELVSTTVNHQYWLH